MPPSLRQAQQFSQTQIEKLLRVCSSSSDLHHAKLVHSLIRQCPIHSKNRYLLNLLMDTYSKCGSIDHAVQALGEISSPNVFTWNIILTAYARSGQPENAAALFNNMPQRNSVSWTVFMSALVEDEQLEQARNLFDKLPQRDSVSCLTMITASCDSHDCWLVFERMLERGHASWNAMASVYVRAGDLALSKQMFDRIPQRNVVTWSVMVTAYSHSGCVSAAQVMFDEMPERDEAAWNSAVQAFAEAGHLEKAQSLLDTMESPGVVAWSAMVTAYSRAEKMDQAIDLFQRMQKRSVVVWTVIITGFCNNNRFPEACEALRKMPQMNVFTCNNVLSAAAELPSCPSNERASKMESLFKSMAQRSLLSWVTTLSVFIQNGLMELAERLFQLMPCYNKSSLTALLCGYAGSGNLAKAKLIFDRVEFRESTQSWNVMLHAYARNNRGIEALHLFRQMQLDGLYPDEASISAALNSCNYLGLLDEALLIFHSISEWFQAPTVKHFCCIVDMLGKAGELDEAQLLVDRLPVAPNEFVWTTLLGSCRIHGHAKDEAQLAAELAAQSEPDAAAPYMLLLRLSDLAFSR